MVDKPDDVPSLSDIGDGDDLPGYWAESTTITVDRWVKQTLDETRNGQPWNQFLLELQRAKNDPLTVSDVDEIADLLADEMDLDGIGGSVRTIEQRTGRIENTLEDLGGGR